MNSDETSKSYGILTTVLRLFFNNKNSHEMKTPTFEFSEKRCFKVKKINKLTLETESNGLLVDSTLIKLIISVYANYNIF